MRCMIEMRSFGRIGRFGREGEPPLGLPEPGMGISVITTGEFHRFSTWSMSEVSGLALEGMVGSPPVGVGPLFANQRLGSQT